MKRLLSDGSTGGLAVSEALINKIFGAKTDEIPEERIKLHNAELRA